jgi:transposase
MDKLLERQEKIQQGLAKKHLTQDNTMVLYDITSSYFEGEYSDSEIVKFGYNRDGKRGHRQIVIALICNKEGCPVAVEVFTGNTKDETTVCGKLREIRQKYGIENLVFVGDRGMVTKAQYEKIDHDVIKVISALTHNNIRELCAQKVIQLGLFDEKNIVEVSDGSRRYCLCKNPVMSARETATRQALLDKTAQELDAIVQSTRKTKYSKEVRIGRVIDKHKMAKFVVLTGSGDDISWKFDELKIAEEKSLDGCYVVYSDTDKFSCTDIVEAYKNLIRVEQAFRSLKTTQLEIRPVYHRTDTRIRCHVFICMLSYYLMWHMKQRLGPLLGAGAKGKARKYTFAYILEVLKSIRQNDVDFCGVQSKVISESTSEQAHILQLLKVKL